MPRKIKQQYAAAETIEKLAPLPLRRATVGAKPYPIDALGKTLGDAVKAVTDKVQCPEALAAQSVLSAAALAVQAHADVVHPALGTRGPISLYFVTVASSGERKTAADKIALEAIRLREAELYDRNESERQSYLNARDAYNRSREAVLKSKDASERKSALEQLGPPPSPPLIPLLTVNEPTLEGLHRLMAEGEPSMGLFSDEAGTFIGGYGMSEEIRLRTGAGLSDFWDAKDIRRTRGGDGVTLLRGRRLSMHLMVQPGIADGLLADPTLSQQGLLSRLLVSAPRSIAGQRMQRKPKATTEPALKKYNAILLNALKRPQRRASPSNPELRPREIRLSSGAQALWRKFADECEKALGDGQRLEPIRGFANKLAEHALRIAAVLELVENLDATAIAASTIERAIVIARYYAGEALRLFEQGSSSTELQRAEKLLQWLHSGWGHPTVALTHVYQLGPNAIRDAVRAREAMSILEHHHWIRPIEGGAKVEGQRYREVWEIVRLD